jgi:hypothetical protein
MHPRMPPCAIRRRGTRPVNCEIQREIISLRAAMWARRVYERAANACAPQDRGY